MVYLYKKIINERPYYYLRLSKKERGKTVVKDIAYLGNDVTQIEKELEILPQKYKKEIRAAYKVIKRFVEAEYYKKRIQEKKGRQSLYVSKELFEEVEAAHLHFQEKIIVLDHKTKEELYKQFVIDFAFNTTSIEGNTIRLQEAKKLLEEQKTPKDKSIREIYDVQNTEKVFLSVLKKKEEITPEFVIAIHDSLLEQIDVRTGYRVHDIRIIGSRFDVSPARYVKTDMNLLLKWWNETKTLHPFVKAILFHQKFERVHPFADGNGRTGRMLLNYMLLKEGYPPCIIRRKKREEYIRALRSADEADLFVSDQKYYKRLVEFIAQEYVDSYWNLFLI